MKRKTSSSSTVSTYFANLGNNHIVSSDGTNYYTVTYSAVGDDARMKIYESTDPESNGSEIDDYTYTPSVGDDLTVLSRPTFADSSYIFSVWSGYTNPGGATEGHLLVRSSDDGGSSWNNWTDDDVDRMTASRPFEIDSDYYLLNMEYDAGPSYTLTAVKITPASEGTIDTLTCSAEAFTYGNIYNNKIYLVCEVSGTKTIYTFDGTNFASVESFGLDVNLAITAFYYKFSNSEIFLSNYKLAIRIGELDWTTYSDGGGLTVHAPILRRDATTNSYQLEYCIWDTDYYWVSDKNILLKIGEVSADNWQCGFDGWCGGASNDLTQLIFETIPMTKGQFVSQLMTPYQAQLEQTTQPENKIWLLLYDDDESTKLGIYKVDSYTQEGGIYQLKTSGGDAIDLRSENDTSYSTKDIPDILTDEIDDYCSFFYQDGNISTTPATTYDKTFKNKNLESKFRWMQAQEGYIISWDKDYNIYYDQFSASGVTILDTDIVNVPTLRTEALQYSKIVIYGGFLNGTRLSSMKYGEPNFGTYYDWFAEVVDQTELDNLATQIENDKNLELKKLKIKVQGKGFIRAGTSLTVTCTQYSISAETWYCVYSKYDAMTDECELMLTDAVYIPAVNQHTEQDIRIQSNQQNIAVLEEKTTWTDRDPSQWDFEKGDLTDVLATWSDLDLSGIIGSNQRRISLHIEAKDNAAGSYMLIRTNGHSNSYNRKLFIAPVANITASLDTEILTDSTGKLEIYLNPKPTDWTEIYILVEDSTPA